MAANVPMPARLRAAWRAVPRGRRWVIVLGALVALLWAASFWAEHSPARYAVLFRQLTPRQGGEVLQALDRLAIPYRVAGDAILVPDRRLSAARMRLAAEGLPRQAQEAPAPALPWLLEPRWRQQLDYQHAMERRAENALRALAYVGGAQVHLTLPPANPFLRQPAAQPGAAAVVRFKSDLPDESQIEAVRALVAAAVPGLAAEQVSVLEPDGDVLALGQGEPRAGVGAMEGRLNLRLQQLLLPWLGQGKVKTQVTVAPQAADRRGAAAPPRISALVLVDAAAYPHWDAAQAERLRTLAAQALGDGAAVQILLLPFRTTIAAPPASVPAAPPAPMPQARAGWRWPLAGAASVLAILLLWRRLRRPAAAPDDFAERLEQARALAAREPDRAACALRVWLERADALPKAASLLLALGEDTAAQVLRRLAPAQVTQLTHALRASQPLTRDALRPVLREFGAEAARQTGLGAEPEAFLGRALTQALGAETAARLLSRNRGLGGFKQLGWLAPEEVAGMLANEPPAVLATVLAHLEREQAARVLALLPAERQEETLLALTRGQALEADALAELDAWLREHLARREESEESSGERVAGDLLLRLPQPVGRRLVEGLAHASPELARSLGAEVLQFADLARLDPASRVDFFKSVPARSLLLALKGADPGLAESLARGMTETAARRLRDDLTALGPVKVADIQQAQAEVLALLRAQVGAGAVLLKTAEAGT